MIEAEHELRLAHEVRAERFEADDDGPDMLVLGVQDPEGAIELFLLSEQMAFALMRDMKTALFDVDPPRSGVGSPGALHGP